jgi:molecular chaperone DnaK (HSP70)
MSVGIDFGTQFTTAAITRRGGIDVVLNESNYRQTECDPSFLRYRNLILS